MIIKSPKVSVIISANQESQYLLETIDSVRQQSFKDFEICVCYDRTVSNLDRLCPRLQDYPLRLLDRSDLNSTEILNLGIAETQGEYIALLKAGDLWHPHKLEKQLFYLEHYPSLGLIHSWVTKIDKRGKSLGKIVKCELSGWVESEILQRNQIGYSSAIVRRNCLEKVGLFDSQLKTGFDWDMWIRLSRCYEFSMISESLVHYRQPRNQIEESWLQICFPSQPAFFNGCLQICFPSQPAFRQPRNQIEESWLTRETDLQATIEKAYQNVSENLLDLKNRSYGYASLNLAWQVLDDRNPDPAIVDHYCRQALEHYPSIGLSGEFVRVNLAVTVLHCLGRDRYICLDSLLDKIRSWQQRTENRFQEFAHLLLDWMLQEEDEKQEARKVLRRIKDKG